MQTHPPEPVLRPPDATPALSGEPTGSIHPITVAAMTHILDTNPYGETRQGRRQWIREVLDAALSARTAQRDYRGADS